VELLVKVLAAVVVQRQSVATGRQLRVVLAAQGMTFLHLSAVLHSINVAVAVVAELLVELVVHR
jgi:hypothetical protein